MGMTWARVLCVLLFCKPITKATAVWGEDSNLEIADIDTAAQVEGSGNCDLTVQGPLCLMKNRRVILPSAAPSNLIGHWTFDDAWPTDSSGNGLHSSTRSANGVGVDHSGFSGSFDRGAKGFVPVEIRDATNKLGSVDSTVSFWIFIVRAPPQTSVATANVDCAILFKGNASSKEGGAPSVYVGSAGLKFGFLANNDIHHSMARAKTGRWYHVRRSPVCCVPVIGFRGLVFACPYTWSPNLVAMMYS